jgi:hypothetical protein
MTYQFRLYIIEVAEDTDTRKDAGLQDEQQQIAHIGGCGSGKYAGTFAMKQEILHQLQQELAAA